MSHLMSHANAHSPSPFPLPPVGHSACIRNWSARAAAADAWALRAEIGGH